ncbi:hypothetical protein [Ferribacterium limneticum]|uniref:hypothetical protein n=1 Tax=Ferribacterium limneticum TaxID=76259 RepID=UPI001CFB254F|nr:hypothetical protein [Ferribacterium limneticum]UCV29499.1 hypothetical protein KI617_05225 [Ferribacterium limneticum]UCV33418.1 hypothetical protein KI608_05225 [Ferribacterium limneticum]
MFLEGTPEGEIDVGHDVALALFRVVDPETEFEVDAAISKERKTGKLRPELRRRHCSRNNPGKKYLTGII